MSSDDAKQPSKSEVLSVLNVAQFAVFVGMLGALAVGIFLATYELNGVKVYLGEAFVLMGLGLIGGPLAFAVLRYLIWRTDGD